ncbi:MAG: hypothetical protein H6606_00840 [Flavobacteriales bacterium]|nr:hypothetical protein [Flavobacteriales bacterium]
MRFSTIGFLLFFLHAVQLVEGQEIDTTGAEIKVHFNRFHYAPAIPNIEVVYLHHKNGRPPFQLATGIATHSTYSLRGAQFALLNSCERTARGVQTGFVNIAETDVRGWQAAFVNVAGVDMKGLQSAFVNVAGSEIRGAQLGFVNVSGQGVQGVQGGFVNASGGAVNGLQFGFVNASDSFVRFGQYGFVNVSGYSGTPVQVGFVNVNIPNTEGAQIGFVNTSSRLKGLQFGLVDTVESGVPIGFLSVVQKGGYSAFELSNTEIFPVQIAYRVGLAKLYTSLLVGYYPQNGEFVSTGIGIGSYLKMKANLFVNPEIQYQSSTDPEFVQFLNAQAAICYRFNPFLEFFGAPSISLIFGEPDFDSWFPLYEAEQKNGNLLVGGLRIGLRVQWP